MPRKKKQNPVGDSRNVARAFTYGPAPILKGEESDAYDQLLEDISGAVGPKDAIEEIWVSDIAIMTWEIIRYRNYKTGVIKAAVPAALEDVLDPHVMDLVEARAPDEAHFQKVLSRLGGQTTTKKLMSYWTLGKTETVEWVEHTLSTIELTMEDINARAMVLAIDDIERIDRLLMRLERSRDALFDQIDRRRAAFGDRLRHAAQEVEERAIEVVDVEPNDAEADDQAA
jgi:hypothetical protein